MHSNGEYDDEPLDFGVGCPVNCQTKPFSKGIQKGAVHGKMSVFPNVQCGS